MSIQDNAFLKQRMHIQPPTKAHQKFNNGSALFVAKKFFTEYTYCIKMSSAFEFDITIYHILNCANVGTRLQVSIEDKSGKPLTNGHVYSMLYV